MKNAFVPAALFASLLLISCGGSLDSADAPAPPPPPKQEEAHDHGEDGAAEEAEHPTGGGEHPTGGSEHPH